MNARRTESPSTPASTPRKVVDEDLAVLEILRAIDEDSAVTQRGLARRCGTALGLANLYLRRCVRKGHIKIKQAPANRYLYYLTPTGFAEKSRLTARFLQTSFSFYRHAGEAVNRVYRSCQAARIGKVGLLGASELAEVAVIRSLEVEIEVVGICELEDSAKWFLGVPVVSADVVRTEPFRSLPAWVLTHLGDVAEARAVYEPYVDGSRILVPDLFANDAPRGGETRGGRTFHER